MADAAKKAEKNIRQIAECSICMSSFTDPRMLPCIHTFCFDCLRHTAEAEQKKPGDKIPCPLCRNKFTIPQEGIAGLKRNFFMDNLMENLLEFKTTLQNNHPTLKIGRETKEEIKRLTNVRVVKTCTKHTSKLLDYYCADCKKIVCVSCFVESHKLHDCKDVTTVDEEFRQMIEKCAWKTSNYSDEVLSLKRNAEMRKTDFLNKIAENETTIIKRSQELKNMIDRHTQSLVDQLSLIKSCHLKDMEIQMEKIDTRCTVMRSFESYCTELRSKGSASDICSVIDQLIVRADEFERYHEAFIGRPHQSVEVSFKATDLREVLQKSNNNFVGQLRETTSQLESSVLVVGLDDMTITKDVVKINLHRPNETSAQEQIPTAIDAETVAVVYSNTMYVIGTGDIDNEIWKYNMAAGWVKCASLVQGRRRHSAAFIDKVLYICGGYVDSTERDLDSVEAYNAVTDKCTPVGKLVHCVKSSGNCVPFKSSLYIFGGLDKDNKAFNRIQMYNTRENTCTLISKPLPWTYSMMRAALWETSVILFGRYTCFIFNLETKTWQERKQFKTDVDYFGLVLENERIFVLGGGIWVKDQDGKVVWKSRGDVRFVHLRSIFEDKPIEWKIHARLPKRSLIHACEKLSFFVP